MRQDLITLLRREQDVTNAVILTHNIDFLFLQSVVCSMLKRCGHPTLTVFADAQCAAETFAYQAPMLDGLGIRYRVVPVAMPSGFRFHPKAVFLSGIAKATLFVGSGNLTFGGWRDNAEMWVHFDSDTDGTGAFVAFQRYLHQIVSHVPLRESVRAEMDEAFDGTTRRWVTAFGEPAGLISKVGAGEALIDQMLHAVGEQRVTRLTVCTPYFDADGEALQALVRRMQPRRTEVLVQQGHAGLHQAAAARLSEDIAILPIQCCQAHGDSGARQPFLHAKFYGVEHGDRVTVFVGSANCSRAALTVTGERGNAELMVVQTVTPTEFREHYLDDLEVVEGRPALPEHPVAPDAPFSGEGTIRLLAARFDDRQLLLGYASAPQVVVTRCLVDDMPYEVERLGHGEAVVRVDHPPRLVRLEGLLGDQIICSNTGWVDHERALRSTSRGRALVEAIRDRVRESQWSVGAWTEILGVFHTHLHYMPPRSSFRSRPVPAEARQETTAYTEEDVFANDYNLPLSHTPRVALTIDHRLHALRHMLLRWFGCAEDQDDGDRPQAEVQWESEDPTAGDEDTVDQPETLPSHLCPHTPHNISDRDRRRAQQLVDQMTTAMTSQAFLAQRAPELLAADLKIAAILLRVGLQEGWLSHADFFACTQKIWCSLFFSSDVDATIGWMEYRYQTADAPTDFAARLVSVELLAALTAWAMAIPADIRSPEHVRFALSWVLAVAHLPWLWDVGEREELATQLVRVVAHTSHLGGSYEDTVDDVRRYWRKMMRRGHALRRLEHALAGRSPADLRHHIRQAHIDAGELVWQGPGGFCVATKRCQRSPNEKVPVLGLQGTSDEMKFRADYVIPLRALLQPDITPMTATFGSEQRSEIRGLIDELQQGVVLAMGDG